MRLLIWTRWRSDQPGAAGLDTIEFYDSDWQLEIHRRSQSSSVDPTRRYTRLIAVFENPIELKLHVGIEIPIHAGGPVVDQAALNRPIIQIEITQPDTELPIAAAIAALALFPALIAFWSHAAKDAFALVVFGMFAREKHECPDAPMTAHTIAKHS